MRLKDIHKNAQQDSARHEAPPIVAQVHPSGLVKVPQRQNLVDREMMDR